MTATMALVLSVSLFANFCLAARSEIEEPDSSRDGMPVAGLLSSGVRRLGLSSTDFTCHGDDRPTGFELYV